MICSFKLSKLGVVQVKVPPLWGAVDTSDGMMMCDRFARFAKCLYSLTWFPQQGRPPTSSKTNGLPIDQTLVFGDVIFSRCK